MEPKNYVSTFDIEEHVYSIIITITTAYPLEVSYDALVLSDYPQKGQRRDL